MLVFYVSKDNVYMSTNILLHRKFYSVRSVTSPAIIVDHASFRMNVVKGVVKINQKVIMYDVRSNAITAVITICQLTLNVRWFLDIGVNLFSIFNYILNYYRLMFRYLFHNDFVSKRFKR